MPTRGARPRRVLQLTALSAAMACGALAVWLSGDLLPGEQVALRPPSAPSEVSREATPVVTDRTPDAPSESPKAEPVELAELVLTARGGLVFGRGTRAHARRMGEARYEVALDDGSLSVGHATALRAAFTVLAGQYRIEATDAEFSVTVRERDGRVQVQVQRGSAEVAGPALRTPMELGPGDSAAADADSFRLGRAPTHRRKRAERGGVAASSFRTAHSEGKFCEALSLAEEQGLLAKNADIGARDAFVVADAARLCARPQDARRLLVGVRDHARAGSLRSEAAFVLGRLSADQSHDATGALRWFRTYLAEAPSGRYAQEALGRVMRLSLSLGDRGAATRSAADYLVRFPAGPHAPFARTLTR